MGFEGHSEAFKQKVLARVDSGEPIAVIAKRFGITPQTIYRWRKDRELVRESTVDDDGTDDSLTLDPAELRDQARSQEAEDFSGQAFGGMSLDGAVSVTVLREDTTVRGSFAWCEDVQAGDFALPLVRQRWGAGRFRFIVRDRLGKPVETRNVVVAPAPSDGPTPVPNAPSPHSVIPDIFDQMMRTMLLRALDPPSVWDNLAKAAPILAPVVGQWIAGRQPSANPVEIATAITNAAGAMAGRSGGGGGDSGIAAEMIKTFREGIALGQTVTSDREPGFADVAQQLAPPLIGLLANKTGQPVPQLSPTKPNGNGHAPQPPAQPVHPQPQVSPMWAALLPSLDALAPLIVDGASRAEPAADLAERIYAATPGYMQSVIEHAAQTPGALDIVMQRYAALAPHRDYVQALLVELGKPAPAEPALDES